MNRRMARTLIWLRTHKSRLTTITTVAVLLFAALALRELLREVHPSEVRAALHDISRQQILLSLGLCALSYFVLTGYDVLALHAIHKPQRYWRAALASFSAYCFSHNLGFAPVTGGAARWRAYRGTNLNAADIARIVVIAGVTFWLGIFLLLGVFLVLAPGALRVGDEIMPYLTQALIGAGVLVCIGLYLVACVRQTGALDILGWTLPIPTLRQAFIQFGLAATDIAMASAALLVLLPEHSWALYPDFIVAYVIAMVVALITQAPGGLGVFEVVVLATLPQIDKATLLSALILYRVIYYWLPLLLAALFLGIHEFIGWRRHNLARP